MGENAGAAVVFVLVMDSFMILPCIGIGWIGVRLINKLGRFPSKTPAIQLGVMFQLIVLEVISFTLLVGFFKALVAE